MNQVHFTGQAETVRTQSKSIADINELSKRILGTAIEVLSVESGAAVIFLPFKTLAFFAVRNKFEFVFYVFYLGICIICGLVLTVLKRIIRVLHDTEKCAGTAF